MDQPERRSRTARGREGEAEAARSLERDGWKVLSRNFRDGPRELDLVVTRHGILAFVEVRTRGSGRWGDPLETLSPWKKRDVEKAARAWLERHPWRWKGVRFDAVAILWPGDGGEPVVRHVPDAWRPGDIG